MLSTTPQGVVVRQAAIFSLKINDLVAIISERQYLKTHSSVTVWCLFEKSCYEFSAKKKRDNKKEATKREPEGANKDGESVTKCLRRFSLYKAWLSTFTTAIQKSINRSKRLMAIS